MDSFPFSRKEIDAFDVVILSDIGANSLLLPDRVAIRSESSPNRLQLIRDFVNDGGGLLMVGGYLTFQGIQAKGNYKGSPVEDVLPIELFAHDDRVESPQGVTPTLVKPDHPVLKGLTDWPEFLATTARRLGRTRMCSRASAMIRSSPCATWDKGAARSSLPIADPTGAPRPSWPGRVTARSGRISSAGLGRNIDADR
jgi:uncharacterized membrane protein